MKTLAVALADGKVNFESFEAPARARVGGLRAKVTVGAAEPYVSAYPTAWGGEVTATLKDGSKVTAKRTQCKGDPELALNAPEMASKARELLRFGGVVDPEAVIEGVLAMASGGPVPEIEF